METQPKKNNVSVQMFKAARDGKKIRANQKIWIVHNYANHLELRFKYRGSGRYINYRCDKQATFVSDIRVIEVSGEFARKHKLQVIKKRPSAIRATKAEDRRRS